MPEIRTRFAPSPTGLLHIGGLRTALFNYLFTKKNNGKFLLRIEDTDQQRSQDTFTQDILQSLSWLKLEHDEEIVYQSQRINRHKEIIEQLLQQKKAYKFFDENTQTEVIKISFSSELKATPIIIEDLIQGTVKIDISDYQDMIICRSDQTPVYMFAVVVDDHDMNISHIIRGVDHLTNTARQILIYKILNWPLPKFAHLGLIYGDDGKKLSKRHGAVSANEFKKQGFLAEALQNYLLRLGWSHGDQEIISFDEAQQLFDLEHINPSPSQFDYKKLNFLNNHYLQFYQNKYAECLPLLTPFLQKKYQNNYNLQYLPLIFNEILMRSDTWEDFAEKIDFIVNNDFHVDTNKHINIDENQELLQNIYHILSNIDIWNEKNLQQAINDICKAKNLKKSKIMPLIRICLTNTLHSPNLILIMTILGAETCLKRIQSVLQAF